MKDWRDILPTRGSTGAPNWTPTDHYRLRVMWTEGVLLPCIARELDRTPGAETTRASMLGLPKRPRSDAVKPKPPPATEAAPVRPNNVTDEAGERFAKAMAGLRYEDDPRAAARERFMAGPPPRTGDVTAAFCGDPTPGRGGA